MIPQNRLLSTEEWERFRQSPIGFEFQEFYNKPIVKVKLSEAEYLALARLEINGNCSSKHRVDKEYLCSLVKKNFLIWYRDADIVVTSTAYKWLCEQNDHTQRFIKHVVNYGIIDSIHQPVETHHIRYSNIFQWALSWLDLSQLSVLLTHDNSLVREIGVWLVDILSINDKQGTCKDCFFRHSINYKTVCSHPKLVRVPYEPIEGGICTYINTDTEEKERLMHPVVSCKFGCIYFKNMKRIVSIIKPSWVQVFRPWSTTEMYDALYDRGLIPFWGLAPMPRRGI